MASAEEKLQLAKEHLERAQLAWDPPDWLPLSLFGFYCLEAAVDAAALHSGIDLKASHWRRVEVAERLHAEHGLPEIGSLLEDLNATRKSEAYGEVSAPDLDAEDVNLRHRTLCRSGREAARCGRAGRRSMSIEMAELDKVVRRWPTTKARLWVEGLLERARCDSNIRAVVAVGSAVRPGVDAEDVDLIVLAKSREALHLRPPIEVDVASFDVSSVNRHLASNHPLLGWAVKYGRVLFDRDDTWTAIDAGWGNQPLLPDPVVARQHAARASEYVSQLRNLGDAVAANEVELARLTLLARASLSEAGVFPASRPELPAQLRGIGVRDLADQLEHAMARRSLDRQLSIRAV